MFEEGQRYGRAARTNKNKSPNRPVMMMAFVSKAFPYKYLEESKSYKTLALLVFTRNECVSTRPSTHTLNSERWYIRSFRPPKEEKIA